MNIKTIFVTLLLAVLPLSSTFSSDLPKPTHVKINLYSTVAQVAPGKPFTVVIEEIIDPGWHTYWLNPGDSGTPTRVKWDLPDGGEGGELEFPTPERIPYGPLVNFGYANRALFQATITPPATLKNETFTINADLDWLVCEDICLPEGDVYSLILPVGGPDPVVNSSINDVMRDLMESQPLRVNWPTTYAETNGQFILTLSPPANARKILDGAVDATYFPYEWGLFLNPAKQTLTRTDDGTYTLIVERDTRALKEINELSGILVLTNAEGKRQGYLLNTIPQGGPSPTVPVKTIDSSTTRKPILAPSLISIMFIATLGGLILNLMPCVFPVLSLKVLSISQMSRHDRHIAQRHGLAYAFGVIATFLIIAVILIGSQKAGQSVGWGFQLQQPVVVALLTYLFVLIGLNLMGWFDLDLNHFIPSRFHHNQEGLTGSFATGILATIVATPCTAPFMGAAMGYALTQNMVTAMVVFGSLGLGLALPFLMICYIPVLQRLMPRPGVWMITLRQFLAFPMFLAAIWLIWVLAQQTGANGVGLVLLGSLCLAAIIWLWHHTPQNGITKIFRVGLLVIAALGLICVTTAQNRQGKSPSGKEETEQSYTKAAFDNAMATDRPVFINMTAAWCITCKVNERMALATDTARALFRAHNVLYLKGDWTNYNADITTFLSHYERNGVPLYVFIGAPDAAGNRPTPVVLPQLLTPALIRETIAAPAT